MTDFETSFNLLSSMSPKLNMSKTKKPVKKSPCKLALKKNFRRSFHYDKANNLLTHDTSVISIDDNRHETESEKRMDSPIVISDGTVSDSQSNKSDETGRAKHSAVNIDNWLSENEKADGYSKVYSFDDSDGSSDEENLQKNHKTDTSSGSQSTKYDTAVDNSFDELDKSTEYILDELYGNDWRKNKNILPSSEPRAAKIRMPINLTQTERKPLHTKEYSYDPSISKNLFRLPHIAKKPVKSPWKSRLKNLCDSDTDDTNSWESCRNSDDSLKNRKNQESKEVLKEINFSDSDNDSLHTKVRKKLAKKSKLEALNKKHNESESDTDKNTKSPKSSTDKNKIDDDNDSLATKIRKKMLKSKLDRKESKDISKETPKKTEKIKKLENNVQSTRKNSESTNQKHSFLKSLSGCTPLNYCDDDAKFYKNNFKTHKTILAQKLFKLYNEQVFDNALPQDTPLEWNDRMRGTAGYCYNKRRTDRHGITTRSSRIVLAVKILDIADRLRDTLIHEMCHAATWIINGVSDGHGPYWKSWAYKAMKTFPELPPIKRCHDYVINTKYTYKCTQCGYCIGRHSKSLNTETKRCGYCYGKFEVYINKVTKGGTQQCLAATPKGKMNTFALFVKENYSATKKADLKHGDVMKLLGQQFSALKVAKNVQNV